MFYYNFKSGPNSGTEKVKKGGNLILSNGLQLFYITYSIYQRFFYVHSVFLS